MDSAYTQFHVLAHNLLDKNNMASIKILCYVNFLKTQPHCFVSKYRQMALYVNILSKIVFS